MKRFLKAVALLAATLIALLFGGCASVPLASPVRDAQSKRFSPPSDKASLYVYRDENFGSAIKMLVSINGKVLGQTAAKTYLQIDLKPGRYKIDSTTENVSTLGLWVDAGRSYFVWQEVKMGVWSARSALKEVDENTGRRGVLESKQISSTLSANDIEPETVSGLVVAPTASTIDSLTQQLQELQSLRENKKITEDEYQRMRAGVLEKYQK